MDQKFLIEYLLHLADDALILGHRNSEWCGHGPVLEQDIAITNISLDLIGQARNFYQLASAIINASGISLEKYGRVSPVTEDSLAYLRDNREFRNCLMVEQPNGDWAKTILRQYFFGMYQYLLYQELEHSKHESIAAIGAKAIKEVTYHCRWSGEWVIRLGDGTDESHSRMVRALDELWMYTGEMFLPTEYEMEMQKSGIGPELLSLRQQWNEKVKEVFGRAGLDFPGLQAEKDGQAAAWMQQGGKSGIHSEHLGYILAELQFMQRAYPGNEW